MNLLDICVRHIRLMEIVFAQVIVLIYEELTDAVLLSIQREARKILSNDDVEELKKTSL